MDQTTYQKIVQNSLIVTGSRIVVFTRFDAIANLVRTVAWAGQPLGAAQRALDVVRRALPGWDPMQIGHPPTINPLVEAVYVHGQPVCASVRAISEGAVDALVAIAGETILGIREGFLCPLKSGNAVVGSLGFYTTNVLSERERLVCEAFVREASLTVENARLVEEVEEHVHHLQDARQRVTAAEERQRQEIAELLHSRVQSNLLLLWNKLGSAHDLMLTEPDRALEILADAQEELDRIRDRDIRQASYLLHPSIIRVGLLPALRSLAARFEGFLDVSVLADQRLSSLDDPNNNRLAEDFRISIYRIAEEALNNVQRHADASKAQLSLNVDGSTRISVRISDDGRGFDSTNPRVGLGLSVIDDRVEQLGGVWEIDSLPGQGTTITATLPIQPSR